MSNNKIDRNSPLLLRTNVLASLMWMSDLTFYCHDRVLEDRELETRIKQHMEKLQQHRSKTYGSIHDELESARENLEMVSAC